MESVQNLAEFFSLTLTLPILVFSIWVLSEYMPSSVKTLKDFFNARNVASAHQFLICGIVIGFIASTEDNAWWGVAWMADFFNHESRDFWFAWGALSNLIFRQGLGVVSATLHLKPVIRNDPKKIRFYNSVWLVTILFGGVLYWSRYG